MIGKRRGSKGKQDRDWMYSRLISATRFCLDENSRVFLNFLGSTEGLPPKWVAFMNKRI